MLALKVEIQKQAVVNSLAEEGLIIKYLNSQVSGYQNSFLECYEFGEAGQGGQYAALELLGPNIRQLKEFVGGTFTETTTLQITSRMLKLIESLHSTGFCHNDIKLDNFCVGLGPGS